MSTGGVVPKPVDGKAYAAGVEGGVDKLFKNIFQNHLQVLKESRFSFLTFHLFS